MRQYITFYTTLILWIALSICSCGSHDQANVSEHRQRTDSLYSTIQDIDILRHHEDSLKNEDDTETLMFVEKQLGKLLRNNSCFIEAMDHHRQGLAYATLQKDTVE